MMLLKSWNQLLRLHRSSYDSSTRLFFFFFQTCRHFRFAQNILCMTTYPTFWPRLVARRQKKGSGEFQAKTADQSRHTAQVSQEI